MEAICEQCGHRFRYDPASLHCELCGSLRIAAHVGGDLFRDTKFGGNSVTNTDIKTTLQNIKFLKDFPEKYLDEIANISRIRIYNRGDTIFREGDDANTLYLIVSGAVFLKVGTTETGEKQIVTLGPGDMLGWSSLTRHPQFAATAVVEGDARIVEIDGARVRAFCDADPKFGYEFMGRTVLALSKRLIATWTQLADVYVTHYAPVPVGSVAINE